MFHTLIALAATLFGQAPALRCPVLGNEVAAKSPVVEYNGAKFSFCCGGCDTQFAKTPEIFLAKQRKAGHTVGTFLFDPVSHKRLELGSAKATADYQSLRYPFESEANRKAFLASPKTYTSVPAKEALYCPVGKEAVPSYAKASDYVDHDGVRYYMCCAGCGSSFEKNPAKYLVAGIEQHIHPAKVIEETPSATPQPPSSEVVTTAKFGKYEAVLRVPEEGIFAKEELDVEFRVVNTTAKDPVEEGFKGVGAIEATGVVTMPSMPGMPSMKPAIHREGVPGDYGVVLYFPHGGDYQIDLNLKIPNDGDHKISFKVTVKDERTSDAPKAQPYTLKAEGSPSHIMAGQPTHLKLVVIDSKTGTPQTTFDVAHEKRFHLMIASQDLNWFRHEHPVMAPDGTWSIPITFPAGGNYWVYGDVAPSGKGSQILISKVSVMGGKPTWDTHLTLSKTAEDGGLKGELITDEIPLGRNTTLTVKLTDAKTGKPAGDTVKWLGAAGHMMIFHQDGQTVVHSHPAEDKESEALVKEGVVHFSGRFPKPGVYKVYAQFDWHGAVRTLGFAIEVK